MDYIELCRTFVAERFAAADIAVVAGSTARGTRTSSSDIDLLVIGDDIFADGRTSLAATYSYGGEVFEVFAYTPDAYAEWADGGMRQHRPVIVQMLVEGDELRGGEALERLRDRWRGRLADGPAVTDHDLATRRYAVTGLVDDLRDSTDDLEANAVAWTLFAELADLMLLSSGRWIGTGKYLPRRLRELSSVRTETLTSPLLRGDFLEFADRAEDELVRVGGRLHAGFVR